MAGRMLLKGLGLLAGLLALSSSLVSAAPLSAKSIQLSSPEAAANNVSYSFGFTTTSTANIGSIKLQFCANYQFDPGDTCQPPAGLDASNVTLAGQSGVTDFSLASRTANRVVLARPLAAPLTPQPLGFRLQAMTNPADVGSNYVWIEVYDDTAASGSLIDDGQGVFAINKSISITTTVPPYLLFCSGLTISGTDCASAEGNFISFGELSSLRARTASSQLVTSTNAEFGYSITMSGTTMTAGTSVIKALAAPAASKPGSNQFGVNARANTAPASGAEPVGPGLALPAADYAVANRFKFASGDVIASAAEADDYRKLTLTYLVNIQPDQPAGNYVATINYICLANF